MPFIYQYQNPNDPSSGWYYSSDVDLSAVIGPAGVGDYRYFVAVTEEQMWASTQQSLDDYKTAAQARVNSEAGDCRSKYITVAVGQDATYILKQNELTAYNAVIAASGTPVDTDYPICNAEATACNMTLAQVMNLIQTTVTQWITLAAQVEGLRRGALTKISAATTAGDVDAVFPISWP